MKLAYVYLLLFLASFTLVSAQRIPVLSVSEVANNTYEGSVASVTLEIQKGTGRVFLDTYPFAKIDTTVSTRIAKDIACEIAQKDCSMFDFIYTIRSGTSTISGPSAGAAMTILTIAQLKGIPVKKNMAITGTINSGGIIGPVSGISYKIDAASYDTIKTVLIPLGPESEMEQGKLINYTAFGNERGVQVIQVGDVYQAAQIMLGISFEPVLPVTPAPFYTQSMQQISQTLCTLARENLSALNIPQEKLEQISDLLNKSQNAQEKELHYAAASFCYGASLIKGEYKYATLQLAQEEAKRAIQQAPAPIAHTSMHALQTSMVVQERLKEAALALTRSIEQNSTLQAVIAIERMNSAHAWATLAQVPAPVLELNQDTLAFACKERLQEIEERKNYLEHYMPLPQELPSQIQEVFGYSLQRDYVSCIFSASQVKARLDLLLTVNGASDTAIEQSIQSRIQAVERVIARQESFPIIGYSYYEYAKALLEHDKPSALLYLQLALELSDLGLYIRVPAQKHWWYQVQVTHWTTFYAGIVVGMIITWLMYKITSQKPEKHKKPVLTYIYAPRREKR